MGSTYWDPEELAGLEWAIGALVLRWSTLESQLGRALHLFRAGDQYKVDFGIYRLHWRQLVSSVRSESANHPDGPRYLELLDQHDVETLGWARNWAVHGHLHDQGTTTHLDGTTETSYRFMRIDPALRGQGERAQLYSVYVTADETAQVAARMDACAAALEDLLPYGFGLPVGGRYLRRDPVADE